MKSSPSYQYDRVKGPSINNNTPWILTDVEYKKTDKVINGKETFYLFIYITMSKSSLKEVDKPTHVFVSFEFFPNSLVSKALDLKQATIFDVNQFINMHGTNIGDRVVHIVQYDFDESEYEFNTKILFNDSDALGIMKDLVLAARRDNTLDQIHTIVYSPTIDIKI